MVKTVASFLPTFDAQPWLNRSWYDSGANEWRVFDTISAGEW